MDYHDDRQSDGLEKFFRDQIGNFQGEPEPDMWDMIADRIPVQPRRNYRRAMMWMARGVAACLFVALIGGVVFQYENRLDSMAGQLENSQCSILALENKINDLLIQPLPAVARAASDVKINTKPSATPTAARVVYLPMPQSSSPDAALAEASEDYAADKAATRPTSPIRPRMAEDIAPSAGQRVVYRPRAFTTNTYGGGSKEDMLDLNKVYVSNNGLQVNNRNLNLPSTQIIPQNGNRWNWGRGQQSPAIIVQASNMLGGDGELRQSNIELSLNKLAGVGMNYNINNKFGVFVSPDYWDANMAPRTLNVNNTAYNNVGVESGLTYRF